MLRRQMFVKRLPLLSAFAGGCLSGAVAIGFWLHDASTPLAPPKAPTGPTQASAPPVDDAADPPSHAADLTAPAAPLREPLVAEDTILDPPRVAVEAPAKAELVQDSTPEPGSSVVEVLARLEAAYREERDAVAAAAPEPRPQAPLAPRAPATQAAVATAPAPHPVVEPPAAPPPAPVVAPAPSVPAAVALATPGAAPGSVNAGTLQQNVQIGSLHQGDSFHVNQVAIYQYVPLLPLVPSAFTAAPVSAPRRVMSRRTPASPTALMNPDNPWGFDFPPTVLVK